MSFADPQKGRSVICGPGPAAGMVTLAGTCVEGDVLGYSSGWKRALATVTTVVNPQVVALKGGVSGDVIPVALVCVVTGYTDGTPGGLIYLAEGTSSGKVTDAVPSTTGDVKTVIGVLLDATTIAFNMTNLIVLA
ncbi:MAG: hypothetical protein D4R38_03110 [Dehalococcoidia bacterium]|nr:MAG: hypothetical protein D4R38_03110 [Dehalococcoidia bacterium]